MLDSLCSAPAPARKGSPGPRPPPSRLEAIEVAWGSQPGIIPYADCHMTILIIILTWRDPPVAGGGRGGGGGAGGGG